MADEQPVPTFRGRDLVGVGGLLVGAVVLGIVLGLWYDDATGHGSIGLLVGVLVGAVVGCIAAVVRVRHALRGA